MSPALSGNPAIRCFEGCDALEIHDGITFNFYTGLPQMDTTLSVCIPSAHLMSQHTYDHTSCIVCKNLETEGSEDLGTTTLPHGVVITNTKGIPLLVRSHIHQCSV